MQKNIFRFIFYISYIIILYSCSLIQSNLEDTVENEIDELTYYSITYDGNGHEDGTVPVDETLYLENSTINTRSDNYISRTDYTLNGWNTKADSTGDNYLPGYELIMGTENIILYANWSEIDYPELTYYGNGAESGLPPEAVRISWSNSEYTTLSDNIGDLRKEGYIFSGWTKGLPDSGHIYSNNTDLMSTNGEDIDMYAVWKKLNSITYSSNDASSGIAPLEVNKVATGVYYSIISNSETLAKDGYIFQGWNTLADGTGIDYVEGDIIKLEEGELILYAKFLEPGIGLIGPSGGYIFYDDESDGVDNIPDYRYLESTKNNLTEGKIFLPLGYSMENFYDENFGAGITNTETLINLYGSDASAAYACDTLITSYNGEMHNDWFLPSHYELRAMLQVFLSHHVGNIDGFDYWSRVSFCSSSSFSDTHVYVASPVITYSNKGRAIDSEITVRPVRAFN